MSSARQPAWGASCIADDPQGTDTIDTMGGAVDVAQASVPVASYVLVCDTSGSCAASFREHDDGVSCVDASSYTFTFVVQDEDGNTSAPVTVVGEQGE